MANVKISELTAATTLAATDELEINAAGVSKKATAQKVLDLTTGTANTFTAAQTFRAANAIRTEAASTQDAVVLAGRAGGTASYAVTVMPATLSANRTLTLPDASGTVLTTAAAVTVAQGGTGATTLTGVLKGNGTSAFTAATAGTDYVAPATATTFTALQSFVGSTSVLAAVFDNAAEVATISATAATGTINYDVTTQSVLYYTTNASGNFTVNFRASSGTSLNTAMTTGQAITVAFLVTCGATAYYNSAIQVDGGAITPKWQGGSAPTAGNASSVDIYTYTIVKTGSAAFTVFASQTQFK